MFQANSSSALHSDDDATIALGASLLLPDNKYARLWRRSLYVGIFISLKRSDSASAPPNHDSPASSPSSVLYTPLLPSSPSAVSVPPNRTSSSKSVVIEIVSDNEGDKRVVAEEQRIKNDIARIVKENDLNSLLELGGLDRVASVLAPCHAQGIIDNENHQILETARPVHEKSFSYFFLNCCKRNSYTIFMLLISAGLSFAIEIKQEGPRYGWHDGVAIVVAVVLLIAFSSVANFWRERKMLKLSKKDKLEFTILRGKKPQLVAISDITVGDIVRLKTGDKVPADGLFISDGNFVLDEPRDPEIDRQTNPFLSLGSKVLKGHGWMLVTSVRDKTNLVEMQSSMAYKSEKKMLLESRIEKPISYVDNLALFISSLVALVILIRLIFKLDGGDNGLPEIKGKVSVGFLMKFLHRIFLRPQGKVSSLTNIIPVAILCMQHGMPLVVTISLKYQMDKVVSSQVAELHDLSACPTMGLTTVICIDASGGLLCKLIEVSRIWMGEKDISKDEKLATDLSVHKLLQQGVGVSVLAPELSLSLLSNSLVSWAETTWEMDIDAFKRNFTILQHSKLDSVTEGSGVLVRKVGDNDQVLHLHWIGSASTILNMCSQYYDRKGECHAMENQKIEFEKVIKEMEDSGLKPIAFAYRQTEEQEVRHNGLILVALIGLKVALEDLKKSGIKIKLVSEDDIMAVRAKACELGMPVEDCIMLEGKEIQDLNDTARLEKVDLALVMGGFLPEHKLLMVQCLKEKGHVVAFFGGLTTSDTGVLNLADVGIVENSSSTTVVGESFGISIKCSSALSSIVRAGRSQYHNIQKFIQLQLTASLSGLLITLITTMSTGESPLTAVQLIWVNMQMFLLGGLMMKMQLISEEQLTCQPSDKKQSLITKEIWKDIVIQVLYQASVSMIFRFGGNVTDSSKEVRTTLIFNTFMLCQLFNQLNAMHLLKKGFKVVLQSYCFLVTLGFCLLMQVLVIQYAKGLADCMRLNTTQWAICILVAALSWGFGWALKFLPVFLKTKFASESVDSSFFFTSRRSWFYLYYLGIPFLIFLFFHVPYYIDQRGQTYR